MDNPAIWRVSITNLCKKRIATDQQKGAGIAELYVVENLTDERAAAARWMLAMHGMQGAPEDFANIILFWPQVEKVAKHSGKHMVVSQPIGKGDFNLQHLIQYLERHRS